MLKRKRIWKDPWKCLVGGCELIDYKVRVLTRKTATQVRLACAADRKLAVPEGEPGTIT